MSDITGDGGVIKEIIKAGEGDEKPRKGMEVTVHYVGTLLDGTKFDSSRDRGDYFKFKLGEGQVIKGWDTSVATMLKGEICKVTLKPEYAYGESGSPPKIPPNSTLVFEIELIDWEAEKDLSGGEKAIMKKILVEGEDYKSPSFESKCKISLRITSSDGSVNVPQQVVEITLGNDDITEGLEKILESMKVKEKCVARVKSKHAYGEKGSSDPLVPPNTDLIYEVELLEFDKPKDTWQLESFEEKEQLALKRKNEGNSLFEKGKLRLAAQKYEKALEIFKHDNTNTEEEKTKIKKEVKLPCSLNLAAVRIKEKNYKDAIEHSTKALEIDSENVKGLWRRGVAHTELGDWIEAERDLYRARDLDPENTAVKNSIIRLKKSMELQNNRDRKKFQNLFSRLAEMEQEEKKETKEEGTPQ